jgi:type II secretory pathway predicted ATPase ExeA
VSTLSRLSLPHRLVLRLLVDNGIALKVFWRKVGLSEQQWFRLASDRNYQLASSRGRSYEKVAGEIVKALIDLDIAPDLAVRWEEWCEPVEESHPRLWFVLQEAGISLNQAAELLDGGNRSRFMQWLNRPVQNRNGSIVKNVERNIIPWLIHECGIPADRFEGWQYRLSDRRWVGELLDKEGIMFVSAEERSRFGLIKNPFTSKPWQDDFSDFYLTDKTLRLVDNLLDAVSDGQIVAVVGPKGSGKSTIRDLVEMRLARELGLVPVSSCPVVNKRFDTHQIIIDLVEVLSGRNVVSATLSRKVDALVRELKAKAAEGLFYVLLADEADKLADKDLLNLKMLNEFAFRGRRLLSVVMFGQLPLAKVLDSAKLQEVRLRTSSFFLDPLVGSEVEEYLRFRLRSAGNDSFVTPDGWQALLKVVESIPGRDKGVCYLDAHKLMARVIKYAASAGFEVVDADVVSSAFAQADPAAAARSRRIA